MEQVEDSSTLKIIHLGAQSLPKTNIWAAKY